MFIGEVAAQKLDKKNRLANGATVYDKEKIKQLTVVGISQGPLHHYTYEWMERLLPGTAKMTVGKKILSDQVR
jgi:protein Mpv17